MDWVPLDSVAVPHTKVSAGKKQDKFFHVSHRNLLF